MPARLYDLEHRLLNFAAAILRLEASLPKTRSGNHVAGQMLRSGTSPLSNHAEAQAAESRNDFVHKMSICLKELRETMRWLRLIEVTPLSDDLAPVRALIEENEQLIRIFKASVTTARKRLRGAVPSSTENVEPWTSNAEL